MFVIHKHVLSFILSWDNFISKGNNMHVCTNTRRAPLIMYKDIIL